MLNLHQQIINNYLNNTILEELDKEWVNRILPESRHSLIQGYYNAGILVMNMSDFNNNNFYDNTINKSFSEYCELLYKKLRPIIEVTMRRMFKGFNQNLQTYEVVLFMEGGEESEHTPVKYHIKIF